MKIFNSTLTGYLLITLFASLSIANVEAASNRKSSRKNVDENSQCDISKRSKSDSDNNNVFDADEKGNDRTNRKSTSRYDDTFKDRKYATSR